MMAREMKDSGIEWIGEIPKEWEIEKGKHILARLERPVKEDDGVITCFRDGEVTLRSNRREEGFTFSIQETGYQGIEPNDLVVHGMDGFAGAIGISDSRGKATPVLNVLDSSENKKYIMYYLRSMAYNGVFLALATGIRVRTCDTNWNKLKELPYPLPSKEEQAEIATYLDNKCTEIDSVIEKTKSTIEEYKKLKQSVITEAVTKGIRPNREMKDSGIEWIGEICTDYAIYRLKHLLRTSLMYGANDSGILFDETLPRYIRITDITLDGKLKDEGKLSLSEESASPYILEDNDILFARSGATVGKAFIYKKEYGKSAFAGYLIKASTNNRVIADYVFYYTQSSIYEEWKKQIFIQATIQNIGADRYSNLPIVIPNVNEQKKIVHYLKEKCTEIDTLIAKKEQIVSELESYKKSLIYEYVTGKKEVV